MKTCALWGVTLAPEDRQRGGRPCQCAGKACSEQVWITLLHVLDPCCLIDAVLCCELALGQHSLVYDSQEHRATSPVCLQADHKSKKAIILKAYNGTWKTFLGEISHLVDPERSHSYWTHKRIKNVHNQTISLHHKLSMYKLYSYFKGIKLINKP